MERAQNLEFFGTSFSGIQGIFLRRGIAKYFLTIEMFSKSLGTKWFIAIHAMRVKDRTRLYHSEK